MSTFTSLLRSPPRRAEFRPAILLARERGRFDCTCGKRHSVPSAVAAQAAKKMGSGRTSRGRERPNAGRRADVNRARLARAQRGAEILLERADDSRRESGELRIGEGGFSALERHPDHQGVGPGSKHLRQFRFKILAEKLFHFFVSQSVGWLNTLQFRNGERPNRLLDFG